MPPRSTRLRRQSVRGHVALGHHGRGPAELAGTVLTDLDRAFSFDGISGVVQNRVVRETATGTLDFYWRVIIDPQSNGGVTAFRLANFGYDSLTDADYRIDGLGPDVAAKARLFNPAVHPGGDINFLLADPLASDASSNFFFLHTDATNYAASAFYDMVDSSGRSAARSAPASRPPPRCPSRRPRRAALGLLTLGLLHPPRSAAAEGHGIALRRGPRAAPRHGARPGARRERGVRSRAPHRHARVPRTSRTAPESRHDPHPRARRPRLRHRPPALPSPTLVRW